MSDQVAETIVPGRWDVLRSGRSESEGLEIPSMPLSCSTEAGAIRLSVGPSGEARLLVPLVARELVSEIETGGALRIDVTTLMHRERAIRFLDVVCLSSELDPVFGEIVDEVVRRIAAGKRGGEAVATAIHDFRALLIPPARQQVERFRIAGLVAELVVLVRLLEISPSAWRSWRGPAGDRHDFRNRGCSLEIKASLGAGAREITINSLDQLEAPSAGSLHLAHFILEQVEGGLLTVSALGSTALERADDSSGLRDLLAAVGCADVQDFAWNRIGFRIEAERLYRVDSHFPRLVPSTFVGERIPAGIVDATYQVDLGFAADCACPTADFNVLFHDLCR